MAKADFFFYSLPVTLNLFYSIIPQEYSYNIGTPTFFTLMAAYVNARQTRQRKISFIFCISTVCVHMQIHTPTHTVCAHAHLHTHPEEPLSLQAKRERGQVVGL